MAYDLRNFGKNMSRARHQYGETQERLAEALGLSANFIAHLERGSRKPSLDTIAAICERYGKTPDMMFGIRSIPTRTERDVFYDLLRGYLLSKRTASDLGRLAVNLENAIDAEEKLKKAGNIS